MKSVWVILCESRIRVPDGKMRFRARLQPKNSSEEEVSFVIFHFLMQTKKHLSEKWRLPLMYLSGHSTKHYPYNLIFNLQKYVKFIENGSITEKKDCLSFQYSLQNQETTHSR